MKEQADLTGNQKACLRLVAQGMTSKEIAARIGLSPSTVDTYLKAASSSLGAANRRDAARRFLDGEARSRTAMSQDLGYQTPDVAGPIAMPEVGGARAEEGSPAPVPTGAAGLLRPPSIGGSPNDLGRTERMVEVMRIAILMAAVMTGLVLFALGAIKVLR